MSVLPSQTVSSVEQGPLAILSQEETIRMAQQSDTGPNHMVARTFRTLIRRLTWPRRS